MTSPRTVLVFRNNNEMAGFMVRRWVEISQQAIGQRRYFAVALSGGRTPVGFYRKLADTGKLRWDRTHIFLVDERFVPFSHQDSNYGMLRSVLLSRINIPQENIHPVVTEEPSPESSAQRYEDALKEFFALSVNRFPQFDLIVLGIGEDGHTASLFPGSELLKEKYHLAGAALLDEVRHHRITLTLPVINRSRNVFFLVSGKNKAGVFRRVIEDRDSSLPAVLVAPKEGPVTFLADEEASDLLTVRRKKESK